MRRLHQINFGKRVGASLPHCRRCGWNFRTTTDPEGLFCTPCHGKFVRKAQRWAHRFLCNVTALEGTLTENALAIVAAGAVGWLFAYALGMSIVEALS